MYRAYRLFNLDKMSDHGYSTYSIHCLLSDFVIKTAHSFISENYIMTITNRLAIIWLFFSMFLLSACDRFQESGGSVSEEPTAFEEPTGREDMGNGYDCPPGTEVNECGGCGELAIVLGDACDVEIEGALEAGDCTFGFWMCGSEEGALTCASSEPGDEICDGVDNDCDLNIDEGFDLLNDAANCGVCGNICGMPNAFPDCILGECVIDDCQPGFLDTDGLAENGCEDDCIPDSSPTDDCDGLDNDCDGLIDEDYVPYTCGIGNCVNASSCSAAGFEVPCSPLTPDEEIEVSCDAEDNDCDGLIDEDISIPCENDCGIGEMICRNGEYPACSTITEDGEVCIDISFFCETIPVELEMPLPTLEEELGVDVVFVFDRSGSFYDDLATFQTQATTLTTRLGEDLDNLAVGLSSFVDAPCFGFGYGTDFGYELNLALTTELSMLNSVIDTLDIRSGSDGPESQLEAMYQALTGEGVSVTSGSCAGVASIPPSDMEWRDRSISFLFMSTDADFHQPTDASYPYPHSATNVIDAALELGTRVYTLQSAGTIDDDAYRIADATGGEVLELDSSSSELVSTVTEAVFNALANTEVQLIPEGDDAGFVTDIFPSYVSGLDLLTNTTMDVTVTLLSSVDPTGEEQIYTFDLVFYVNDGEVARRPVTITIPADDPKDCNNRPPIIRFLDVPQTLLTGETATVSVEADEPDDNPMLFNWESSGGSLLEPIAQSTVFTAPDTGGLVDISVLVSDFEERSDSASTLVHIRGDECIAEVTGWLDIGLTEGRMVLEGSRGANDSGGSCGGDDGGEGTVILSVHEAGTYLITVEPLASWVIYLRETDCETELACIDGDEMEVDLDEGEYFLFLDTNTGGSGIINLYIERVW
jgi:hypothetical protein